MKLTTKTIILVKINQIFHEQFKMYCRNNEMKDLDNLDHLRSVYLLYFDVGFLHSLATRLEFRWDKFYKVNLIKDYTCLQ